MTRDLFLRASREADRQEMIEGYLDDFLEAEHQRWAKEVAAEVIRGGEINQVSNSRQLVSLASLAYEICAQLRYSVESNLDRRSIAAIPDGGFVCSLPVEWYRRMTGFLDEYERANGDKQ